MNSRSILLGMLLGSGVAAYAAELPASAAQELYQKKCAACHSAEGNSPLEPLNFSDDKWNHGSDPDAIAKVISEGVTGTAMLPFKGQLKPEEIEALAAYVRSFDKSLKPAKKK